MTSGPNPIRRLAGRLPLPPVPPLRWRRLVVRGESMRPHLEPGDRVLVAPAWRVRPGDVVAVDDPERPGALVVKRVAGRTDDHVVVLGDRRTLSVDSRHYGPVPVRTVRGRVVYRYAPASRAGRLGRGSLDG